MQPLQQPAQQQLSPLVWFELVDSVTGNPYKATSVSSILRSSIAVPVIDQFRDAVKAKHSNKLALIDAADLVVYKNKAAFDKRNATIDDEKEKPLDPMDSLDELGNKEDKLVVVVPSSSETSVFQTDNEVLGFLFNFQPQKTFYLDEFLSFDTKSIMDGEIYSDSYLNLPRQGKDTSIAPRFSIVAPIGKIYL
jgi:hypothetical protein